MWNNALYEVRMNEFCHNHMNQPQDFQQTSESDSRPKCSVSPLNDFENTQLQFNDSHLLNPHLNISQIDTNSPFVNRICYTGGLYPLTTLPSQHDSGLSMPLSEVSTNTSPTCLTNPRTTKSLLSVKVPLLQYQSTPNKLEGKSETSSVPIKRKANFHSIMDLAKSSDDSANYSGVSTDAGYLSSSSVNHSYAATANSMIDHFNGFYKSISSKAEACSKSEPESKENLSKDREFIYKTKRRARAQISKQQREILEYAYRVKCYPDSAEVEYLCSVLGFEENVIRVSCFFLI